MIPELDVEKWEEGWRTYDKRKVFFKFVPGSRRKIAMSWLVGEPKAMYWYDGTRKCWRKAGSIYALHRMLAHALQQYEHMEIPQLAEMLQQSSNVDAELVLLPSLPLRDRTMLQSKIVGLAGRLRLAQDDLKREARHQYSCVISLTDSNGRQNVAVLRTRNTTAKTRLEHRIAKAYRIKGYIARYFTIVDHVVWELKRRIISARNALDPIAWNKGSFIPESKIKNAINDASELTLPPFRFTRHIVPEDLTNALLRLKVGEEHIARTTVRRAWESLEMQAIGVRLQETLLLPKPDMEVVATCHNNLSPRRISENGFRYPGKRNKAQSSLFEAIRLNKLNFADKAREKIKEAANCF